MLSNAYLLAKIGADTAENEQHFAENLPKIGNYPTGRLHATHHTTALAAPEVGLAEVRGVGPGDPAHPELVPGRLEEF